MGYTGFKISQLDNMQNRAAYEATGDSIRIEVYSNIDSIPFHNRHVAINNIVMTTVAHVDAERLERIRRD